MLNKLNNILLIFILSVFVIFIQQIMDTSAQELAESEIRYSLESDPYLLDNDFMVEKFVTGLDLPVTMEFMGNDLLVVQKNDGKVRLIRENILQNQPVLDVEVSNYGETGLLGITSNGSDVYLFFTEAFHDGGLSLESRIYAYTWNGQKLVEPRLVKALPGWPQGGGAHYSGVLTTDLSKNVYAIIGNQYKFGILQNYLPSESFNCNIKAVVCNSSQNVSFSDSIEYTISCINISFHHYTTNPFSYQTQQPDLSDNPWETNLSFILQNIQSCFKGFIYNNFSNGNWEDTSVILKIVPNDDDYYAIGVRNSFGLTVDPLTGNLWMTDNGNDKYDEINLVLEKSNLGATKYVGSVNKESVATVPSYEEYVYKNPELIFHIPILLKWFAKSDIVVSIRDPRDTICSFIEIGEKHKRNNISSKLSKIGRDINLLCYHYFQYYNKIFKNFKYFQKRCLIIKYEDIVNKKKETINYLSKGLSINLDFSFDDIEKSKIKNSLSYQENLRESFASAFWNDEYLEKINTKKIGVFNKKLSKEEIRLIEKNFIDFNKIFKYWKI